MRKVFTSILPLIVLVVLLAFAGTAAAQEAPADTQTPIIAQEQNNDLFVALIAGMGISLISVLAGGGTVYAIVARLNASKPAKDSTEKYLFNSVPLHYLMFTNRVAQGIRDGAEFIFDVTDGKPNEEVQSLELELPDGFDPALANRIAQQAVSDYIRAQPAGNPAS